MKQGGGAMKPGRIAIALLALCGSCWTTAAVTEPLRSSANVVYCDEALNPVLERGYCIQDESLGLTKCQRFWYRSCMFWWPTVVEVAKR